MKVRAYGTACMKNSKVLRLANAFSPSLGVLQALHVLHGEKLTSLLPKLREEADVVFVETADVGNLMPLHAKTFDTQPESEA